MRDASGPNIYMECFYIHAVAYYDVLLSMLCNIYWYFFIK